MHGEKVDIDLASMGTDFPEEVAKKERLLESIQMKIRSMVRNGGKKDMRQLNEEQKQFIKDLVSQSKKPRKITILQDKRRQQAPENSLHFLKSILTEVHITQTFDEIQSPKLAKLLGLCSHFCYWCIFGKYNQLPLDDYHMKQLFISMLQCMNAIQQGFCKNEKMK